MTLFCVELRDSGPPAMMLMGVGNFQGGWRTEGAGEEGAKKRAKIVGSFSAAPLWQVYLHSIFLLSYPLTLKQTQIYITIQTQIYKL